MKFYATICLLVLCIYALEAETHIEPMRAITERSCQCIEKLDLTKLKNSEQRNVQLGLCVIKSAKGFEKFLKSEKNIDMERIGDTDHGTRLGYLFAVEAAAVCPETLGKFTADAEGSFEGTVSGRITDTNGAAYTKLTVEDTAGKTTTLYWIFNFENSNLLLKNLGDKTARFEFTYVEKEVFFFARKEYNKVKIITAVKKL
jgi:hypothetical protein